MKNAYNALAENNSGGKPTYVIDEFEKAAFRFSPLGNTYSVYIKWEGKEEQEIDKTAKIVLDTLLGGELMTEKEYLKY